MRVPVCGYKSKTAAIQALMAEGLSREVIAARVGIPVKQMTGYVAADGRGRSAARRGAPAQEARPADAPAPTPVALGRDTIAALRPHARHRGVSVAGLLAIIADTIAREGLVDAVLDDREDG